MLVERSWNLLHFFVFRDLRTTYLWDIVADDVSESKVVPIDVSMWECGYGRLRRFALRLPRGVSVGKVRLPYIFFCGERRYGSLETPACCRSPPPIPLSCTATVKTGTP